MKSKMLLGVLGIAFVIGVIGCSQPTKSVNSTEAVDQAKALKTVDEQVKYLVKEANGFVKSEKFEEAIKLSKYVLSQLDSESQEAKSVLQKAEGMLKELAMKKAEEAKAELQKKMGNLGQ